jgi:hypothetical protein
VAVVAIVAVAGALTVVDVGAVVTTCSCCDCWGHSSFLCTVHVVASDAAVDIVAYVRDVAVVAGMSVVVSVVVHAAYYS